MFIIYSFFLQQQIHAQQLPHGTGHGPAGLPLGPHPGLPAGMGPAAGLLGFGAAGLSAGVPSAGGPHPSVAAHPLLKSADLHSSREPQDLKRPGSTSADERLVRMDSF